MTKTVPFVLSMDCERVNPGKPFYPAGPRTERESARNIAAFIDIARETDFPVTLFLTPEAATLHAGYLKRLDPEQVEFGLHLHPRTFGLGVSESLGLLEVPVQERLLAQATDIIEEALGRRPVSFRAGFYSANESTFRILKSLGYHYSSTTVPGRYKPAYGIDWRHIGTGPVNIAGIWEFPLSASATRRLPDVAAAGRALLAGIGASLPGMHRPGASLLRLGINLARALHATRRPGTDIDPASLQIEHRDHRLRVAISREILSMAGAPVLVCTTHNDVDFTHPRSPHTAALRRYLHWLRHQSAITPAPVLLRNARISMSKTP